MTDDMTAQAFEQFAQAMCQDGSSFSDSQAKIDFVKERIEDLDLPCLSVFHSYDNLETFKGIRSFFATDNRYDILITSHHQNSIHLKKSMPIPNMSQDEAVALLLPRSGIGHDQESKKHAREIAHHLGHPPLAIAQARAYIRSRRIPLSALVARYDKRASAVLKQIPKFGSMKSVCSLLGNSLCFNFLKFKMSETRSITHRCFLPFSTMRPSMINTLVI